MKRQFDLFVHGNLISRGYCVDWNKPSKIESDVPYKDVDLKHGIIIEGDMEVDNIANYGKRIGVSGCIASGRALSEEEYMRIEVSIAIHRILIHRFHIREYKLKDDAPLFVLLDGLDEQSCFLVSVENELNVPFYESDLNKIERMTLKEFEDFVYECYVKER